MPLFKYRALDADGEPAEGILEEDSARQAVVVLQGRGLTVNAVEDITPKRRFLDKKSPLRWRDIEQLNEQLLMIVRSGLPLASGVAAIARDLRNPRLRPVLEDVRRSLETGNSLEEALARHPESFTPVYTQLIRAGERINDLPAVLESLLNYSKQMVAWRTRLTTAAAYPALVLCMAAGILTFLLVFVVPVFAEIFMDFGGSLPAPTEFLVHLSRLLVYRPFETGFAVVMAVLALAAFVKWFTRSESRGFRGDTLRLWMPLFGKLYASVSMARFCRALGMLLSARVPLVDSLDLAAAASGNAVLRHAVTRAAQKVAGGARLAEAFEQSGYFDHTFCWLLSAAEDRGDPASMFLALESDYDHIAERRSLFIARALEPLTVVCIGFMVGFVVVSLYLPIFSLGDCISGS